jgi:release factor glutamine methyltransferase
MTIPEAFHTLYQQLTTIYEDGEAAAISDWILEHLTGAKKTERLVNSSMILTPGQTLLFEQYVPRLLRHEPVEYVLNESWFCGLKFYVDQHVLIPRPETEELVEWVITNCRFPIRELSILDIGTGSGCIAISLKRKLRKAEVWSCDLSEKALEVAKKNAITLGVDVNFRQIDFLKEAERNRLSYFDIIVSNPPYIPESNKVLMAPNVLQFEPAMALFVPNNDALVFYRAIALFAKDHLSRKGSVYLEIHEDLAAQTVDLFQSHGFQTELKKDMQGKERMLRCYV